MNTLGLKLFLNELELIIWLISKWFQPFHIYIYIYIVIHRQICFVLSELTSVARQYLPVTGIETRLTQMPSQSF